MWQSVLQGEEPQCPYEEPRRAGEEGCRSKAEREGGRSCCGHGRCLPPPAGPAGGKHWREGLTCARLPPTPRPDPGLAALPGRRVLRAPTLWESLQVPWNLQRKRGEITWTFFRKTRQ
ncbi:hypothetical protein HJG60_004396 [Phyllostomus discolor]|uniref:Uncharacterized protein n=1 Tax=Phyllostomus discolor TaxID=89673 RepID=A0A834BBN0_9CHIR|nr:hypothetical protein HJG60_004396 [Phyllostomus discolor]